MARLRWWVLAFLAALVLLGSAAGMLWKRRPRPAAAWIPPVARVRCPEADAPMPSLVVPEDRTPVVVARGSGVRLLLDGAADAGPLEDSIRLVPGEHTLRAEVAGSALQLKFRLEPFRPALFHAEVTPGAGLTLVWLGATCVSCPPPAAVRLDFTRTSATDEGLLEDAASALRSADWPSAGARLRGVQPRSRAALAFRRLAANVYQSAGRTEQARTELEKISESGFSVVLQRWAALTAQEQVRAGAPGLVRWNLLTQRFASLLEKFALEAPGPVQLATSRLAELTQGFLEATQKKDPLGQKETVNAADEALAQFIRTLRRSRPEDCEFQARITASFQIN